MSRKERTLPKIVQVLPMRRNESRRRAAKVLAATSWLYASRPPNTNQVLATAESARGASSARHE